MDLSSRVPVYVLVYYLRIRLKPLKPGLKFKFLVGGGRVSSRHLNGLPITSVYTNGKSQYPAYRVDIGALSKMH